MGGLGSEWFKGPQGKLASFREYRLLRGLITFSLNSGKVHGVSGGWPGPGHVVHPLMRYLVQQLVSPRSQAPHWMRLSWWLNVYAVPALDSQVIVPVLPLKLQCHLDAVLCQEVWALEGSCHTLSVLLVIIFWAASCHTCAHVRSLDKGETEPMKER